MTEKHQRQQKRRTFLSHPLTHFAVAILALALIQGFVVKVFAVPSGSMEQTLHVGDRMLVNRLAYHPITGAHPERGDVVVFSTTEELWPKGGTNSADGFFEGLKTAAKWLLGDILGFGPGTKNMMVKRVIGTPGDIVECCNDAGSVIVNGAPIDEPYVFENLPFMPGELDCRTEPKSLRCFAPALVPEERLLMLGDHRQASSDGIAQCRGKVWPDSEGCVRWAREEDVVGEVWIVVWPLDRFGALREGQHG